MLKRRTDGVAITLAEDDDATSYTRKKHYDKACQSRQNIFEFSFLYNLFIRLKKKGRKKCRNENILELVRKFSSLCPYTIGRAV